MEFWTALGIEQTKDEEAINAAYREKLQLVHPEEHPEEFMQLRAAYDEALKFARASDEEEPSRELTPVELWVAEAEKIYDDISRRVNVEEWKALLEDEVCQGLDSRLDARDGLLKLCMECYYMPNEVWKLIVDAFSIRENYKEICEKFPKAYIDNAVIGGADWLPSVPYELYGKDYTGNPDPFIKLYYKARDERRSGNFDACEATIADMKALEVDHPYDRYAEAELANARNEKDKAVEIITALKEEFPNDVGINVLHGEIFRIQLNDYETALADYEFVLGVKSDHFQARWGKAESLLGLERLEDAKDIYLNLHQQIPYDNNVTERIEEINNKLSQSYEQQIVEQPDNFELRMDYAWNCLQRREYDKAKALIADAAPANDAEKADLENFSTKLYLNCDEYENALAHAQVWEKITIELPEGETDEEKRRKGKTAESIRLQSTSLYALNRYDEALERLDAAEAIGPDSVEICNLRRNIYHRRREFDKAVEQAEKMVRLEPGYVSWYNLGYEQFEQGDKAAAYHSFGEALDYAKVLQAYIYRARILCWFDEWDALKDSIEHLEQNGVEADNTNLRYLKARLLHHNEEKQAALDIYNSIISEYEAVEKENGGADCDFIHEVYYFAADIQDDFEQDEAEVMARVDKGISIREDYYPLLNLKGYLCHKKRDHAATAEVNKKILEYYPKNQYANLRIGDAMYYMDQYEEAVKYYLIQEKIEDSAWIQEVLGLCLTYLERYDEAEPHLRKSIELEPEHIRPRANLGLMYERRWNAEKNAYDFDLSLPLQEECVRLNDEREDDKKNRVFRTWLARCLCRMGRYDEAMAVYRKNFELHGDEEDARKEVELYMESGRFAEGEKLLDKYHKEGLLKDPYLMMKADFRLYQGKDKDFLKYVNKMEDGARKRAHLAGYYSDSTKKKDRQQAMELYRLALDEESDRSDWMTGYITLLREFGRLADAEEVTRKAFEDVETLKNQGWRTALYLTKMAFVHIASGNPDLAKPYIDRAMTGPMCDHCRYRRCKDAYLALMRYYFAKGMKDEAIKIAIEGNDIAPDESEFIAILKQHKKDRRIK